MNTNNNPNHEALQALLAALGNQQQPPQGLVAPQTQVNNIVDPSRSVPRDSSRSVSSFSSVSHQHGNPHQLIQPLVDAASSLPPGSSNLVGSLDVATQVLLFKALRNQIAAQPAAPVVATNNANVPAPQLILQQLQRLQQQVPPPQPVPPVVSGAGSTANVAPPNLVHHQASSQALLAAALAGGAGPPQTQQPPPAMKPPAATARTLARSTPAPKATTTCQTTKSKAARKPAVIVQEDTSMDKREQKRAANRISAQQSRKRRKKYIEDLQEENVELKMLNQVLSVLPDIVVSFDSTGKISYISRSTLVTLNLPPEQLVGKSFWSLLCHKSARRLKGAFMDSLAGRNLDEESVPLGGRIMDVQLKDHNEVPQPFSLHGIVHFDMGTPECVCTLRSKQLDQPRQMPVPMHVLG